MYEGYTHRFGSEFAGIVLTNDGHAVLREIDVGHPAAKVGLKLPAHHLTPQTLF